MKNFLTKQENVIKEVINSLGYNTEEVLLIPSSRKEVGDYQYNGVMSIAKEAHKKGISQTIAVARYKHESNFYKTTAFKSPKITSNQ